MFVHITFTDGSNPFVQYTDPKSDASELSQINVICSKWSRKYNLRKIKFDNDGLYVEASPNYTPVV